jgi:hypothetical protein
MKTRDYPNLHKSKKRNSANIAKIE